MNLKNKRVIDKTHAKPSSFCYPHIGQFGAYLLHPLNHQMQKQSKPQKKISHWWPGLPHSDSALVGSKHIVRGRGVIVRLSVQASILRPLLSSYSHKNKRILENKLLPYCIALVRLPNKMKVLMWHHLRKTQWQTHPTRGCHCPGKRQVAHLLNKQRQQQQVSQREQEKMGGITNKTNHHHQQNCGSLLSICAWVFREGVGSVWLLFKLIASNVDQIPIH